MNKHSIIVAEKFHVTNRTYSYVRSLFLLYVRLFFLTYVVRLIKSNKLFIHTWEYVNMLTPASIDTAASIGKLKPAPVPTILILHTRDFFNHTRALHKPVIPTPAMKLTHTQKFFSIHPWLALYFPVFTFASLG